jgi:quinol monooxygenase YgiN
MFIRVSHMTVRDGAMAEILQQAQDLVPLTQGMPGLRQYYTVQASPAELLTIGVWDSAAHEEAAAGQLHGWLAQQFGPYLAGRPQTWAGATQSVAGLAPGA